RSVIFECPICLEAITQTPSNHTNLECCDKKVCSICLNQYCSVVISEGLVASQCLFTDCNKYLPHGTIVKSLNSKDKKIFNTMIIDLMKDPCIKTCPGCAKPETIEPTKLKEMETSQKNLALFFVHSSDCSKNNL
ncbi:hypothetical protein, partial [Salmonella sp. s51228]|uniref:hypothetical protein n=1 Tax=Salmonella sp. s51228 TaxID=3159652 RepID=UPI0039805C2E